MLKKRDGYGLILLKMQKNKVRLGSLIVENARTRYGWGFNLFKMLNLGTARNLFSRKCLNKVPLGYVWGVLLFKKQNLGTTSTSTY